MTCQGFAQDIEELSDGSILVAGQVELVSASCFNAECSRAAYSVITVNASSSWTTYPLFTASSIVNRAVENETSIFTGGVFGISLNGKNYRNIALISRRHPSHVSFFNLNGGVDGEVTVMAIRNELLFVGGNFQNVGLDQPTPLYSPYYAVWNQSAHAWAHRGPQRRISRLACRWTNRRALCGSARRRSRRSRARS